MDYFRLRGIGVSPGIAVGDIHLKEKVIFTTRKDPIPAAHITKEIARLKDALEKTHFQLQAIKEEIKDRIGEEHAFIFEAHILILEDKSLISSLDSIIREESCRAEWAISFIHEKYAQLFDSLADDYFRQRQSDVSDVLSKIYLNLKPSGWTDKTESKERILVAHDLLPSEAALGLSRGNILAVALEMGGPTSHTAILARSLNIPAVMGVRDITKKVREGDCLIVDGTDGEVIINPPLAIRKEFASKKEKYEDYRKELQKTAKLKSTTLDGIQFLPMANIELPEEVNMAFSLGAEGIGLFRSEFIYLQKSSLPSEDDHFRIYSKIAKDAYPSPVYIRTIDIGGEKTLPHLNIEKEPNPALGLRAIRYSLRDRKLFRVQLRAILRASVQMNVRILIPMVTEIEEVVELKLIFNEVKEELLAKKIKFDRGILLGVMIEVPAAAAITDLLVKEVDYLSIGTNDLIQYYLAVDRSNELVSYLYKPLHPAILRIIKFIIETAQKEGKEITVCGEMAADPLSALVLLGFGLKSFSMNPIFIPRIKNSLRSVEFSTVQRIVQDAMNLKTAQEIEELILERVLTKHPKALLLGQTR